MSQTSSSHVIGIGPSGSLQLTIQVTAPTTTLPLSTSSPTTSSFTPTTSTMSTTSQSATATSSPAPSAAARTPNIGAIVGGTLGGIAALVWFIGLMYFAHHHGWFKRPGYRQAKERDMFENRGAGERGSGASERGGPFGGRPALAAPVPQSGIGARTFGQPPRTNFNEPPARANFNDPPRTNFNDPPRSNFNDPPRTNFNEPPRTTFGALPKANFSDPPRPVFNEPPRSNFNDAPRKNFADLPRTDFNEPPRSNLAETARSNLGEPTPMSNFADRPRSGPGDRGRPRSSVGDRPRSAFGDGGRRSISQDFTRRGFFGAGGMGLRSDAAGGEWEGAGARRGGGDGTLGFEEKGGVWNWLGRVRDNAARRKRVQAEYEEDMRQMRGRSAVESDYSRY
ncbi:hypothetical protein BDV93DRAFT_504674 [Ceratobasidium sp. AG-I]|nr:hypothetical protein BDV93DRAFT_504674 [Ceratobasidium sp. AG-I]